MKSRSDRERVLMNILVDCSLRVSDELVWDDGYMLRVAFGEARPQFLMEGHAEQRGCPLRSGDIVKCVTNPDHRFGVAVWLESLGDSRHLLGEIGGAGMCDMGNEEIDVLRFMRPERLLTGVRHKLHRWTQMAFTRRWNPGVDFEMRFVGATFDGDLLTIRAIPRIFSQREKEIASVTLTWDGRTRLKDIAAVVRERWPLA